MMYMSTKNRIAILLCFLLLFPFVSAVDPSEEIPTDTSISVTIEKAIFEVKELGKGFAEITINVTGKTEGNVHHCGIALVAYYKNGTSTFSEFIRGPIYVPVKEAPIIFIGTGKNDSWETWRFYNKQKIEKKKIGINESQLPYVDSFKIWVRAYSDENETLWNQTYVDLTEKIKGKLEEIYEENLPFFLFFVISIMIIAFIAITLFTFRKKKPVEEFFKVGGYILYEKEVSTKGGKRKIYFFSKKKRVDAKPCSMPKGYKVEINPKTGVPFLKKIK